jgi:hypothetical protein
MGLGMKDQNTSHAYCRCRREILAHSGHLLVNFNYLSLGPVCFEVIVTLMLLALMRKPMSYTQIR